MKLIGKSSSSGRALICGFSGFGSSPKFYPIKYKILIKFIRLLNIKYLFIK